MIITVSGNFKGILHWDQNWSEMYKRAMGQPTFAYATAKEWNDLPKELHACEMLRIFNIKTSKLLIESDKAQHKCNV